MVDPTPDLGMDLSGLGKNEFLARLDDLVDDGEMGNGFFEQLGARHFALMIERKPTLLVSFETIADVQARPTSHPRGFALAQKNDWSSLTILSDGDTWFRDPKVYAFFDRMTDESIFDDYNEILFYGAHAGGYAAAAFSVAAPGANVLALRPVATLNPAQARWDRRYIPARALDFTTRYGYGPDMIEAANRAYVIADHGSPADAMHAALFRKPNVTPLHCGQTGPKLEQLWDMMDITTPMIEAAMAGALTPVRFARLWRARRQSPAYLRTLLRRLEAAERPALARRLCRHGVTTPDKALFARKFDELALEAELV